MLHTIGWFISVLLSLGGSHAAPAPQVVPTQDPIAPKVEVITPTTAPAPKTESKATPTSIQYSESAYYSQGGYYAEGTYYAQGTYYSQANYYAEGSYYSQSYYAPTPSTSCCKICSKGKACGNSCISRSYTCHQPPGCACDG